MERLSLTVSLHLGVAQCFLSMYLFGVSVTNLMGLIIYDHISLLLGVVHYCVSMCAFKRSVVNLNGIVYAQLCRIVPSTAQLCRIMPSITH